MISLEAFSELLEVLYAAPLLPSQWEVFLDLLCKHTQSRSSFLLCADSRAALSVRVQGGFRLPSSIIESYSNQYAQRDPFVLPLIRSGKTGVVDCNKLIPFPVLETSEVYRNVQMPTGYRYPGLVALTCTTRRFEVISFWRTEEEGWLDEDSIHLLKLLVPHIQSVMAIRQALGIAELKETGANAMADASPTATFLVSYDARILHANGAAKALLRSGDSLVERKGFLHSCVVGMEKPLRELLLHLAKDTVSMTGKSGTRSMALERRTRQRPLQLLASPIQGSQNHLSQNELAARVLLLVTDPESPVIPGDEALRIHYGFTDAEIEVANGMLTGYSLEEIAALRRVRIGTIRSQVKSLLAKTETNRQTDLIRILLSLPQFGV